MRAFRKTEIFGNSGCYHGLHLYLFFTLTDRAISAMVPLIVPPLDHVGQNLPAEPTTYKDSEAGVTTVRYVGTEASPPTHTEEKSAVEKRGWQSCTLALPSDDRAHLLCVTVPPGVICQAQPRSLTRLRRMIQGTLKQALGVDRERPGEWLKRMLMLTRNGR